MEIVRLNNPALIKEFVSNSKLYDRMREDHSPESEYWAPNLTLSIWLMVYEQVSEEELDIWGMFAFVPETPILYRFHPAINPTHWGDKQNVKAGQLALDWMWQNTDAVKIVAKAPALYPDALRWAQRVGFSREGVQRNSFMKDGELHDQYHVGISRD